MGGILILYFLHFKVTLLFVCAKRTLSGAAENFWTSLDLIDENIWC